MNSSFDDNATTASMSSEQSSGITPHMLQDDASDQVLGLWPLDGDTPGYQPLCLGLTNELQSNISGGNADVSDLLYDVSE